MSFSPHQKKPKVSLIDAFLAGEVGRTDIAFASASKAKKSLKEEAQTAGQTASKPKENAEGTHQVDKPSKSGYCLSLNRHKELHTFIKDFPCTDISHERPVDACTFQHKRVVMDDFTGAARIVHKGCEKWPQRVGGWLTSDQLQEVAAIVKAHKEVRGVGAVFVPKQEGGRGLEKAETAAAGAQEEQTKLTEQKLKRIEETKASISAAHSGDSISSQRTKVISMTKRGTKWFSVEVAKKVDDAVQVEGVEDDDWEAVDAEEAVESEYVLV